MRVGVLAGFDEALVKALQLEIEAAPGATWVDLKLGPTSLDVPPTVDVVLDRASHENAFYAAWVRYAEDQGVRVVNHPRRTSAGSPFADLVRARKAGLMVAETVLLPAKAYAAHLGASALKNLAFPLDWSEVWSRVSPRARVLPALSMSMLTGVEVRDVEGLLAVYDRTGETPTMVQRCVEGQRVRAFCISGADCEFLVLDENGLALTEECLDGESMKTLLAASRASAAALELECVALDFTLTPEGAVLTAVDAAAAEIEPSTLGDARFGAVVKALAALLTKPQRAAAAKKPARAAKRPRPGS
jgi:hypothetical protein